MKKTTLLAALVAISLTLTGCDSTGQPGSSTENSTAGGSTTSGSTSQPGGTTEGAKERPKGPTEAPDLTSVGSFREGPTAPQGNPTTLVDFEFDQRAYLKGGDRTSFHLARKNGSDALDATSMAPWDDKKGDKLITAVFPGKLKPGDFARGYVDSQTLTSREQGANKDNPSNINQSSRIGDGKTENPDLVSVKRDKDQLLYEFDQPLTEDDVVQNTGGLRIYFPETDNSSLLQAGAISVDRKNASTLKAFFGRDLPDDKKLEEAAGAFVKQGTVQATKGSRGGNAGKSAFDELSTID